VFYRKLKHSYFPYFPPWNMKVPNVRARFDSRLLPFCSLLSVLRSGGFSTIRWHFWWRVSFLKKMKVKIPQRKQNTTLESLENIWIPFKRDETSHKCRSLTCKKSSRNSPWRSRKNIGTHSVRELFCSCQWEVRKWLLNERAWTRVHYCDVVYLSSVEHSKSIGF